MKATEAEHLIVWHSTVAFVLSMILGFVGWLLYARGPTFFGVLAVIVLGMGIAVALNLRSEAIASLKELRARQA